MKDLTYSELIKNIYAAQAEFDKFEEMFWDLPVASTPDCLPEYNRLRQPFVDKLEAAHQALSTSDYLK